MSDGVRYANISSAFGFREIFIGDNETIICVTIKKRKCAPAEAAVESYITSIKSLFLNKEAEAKSMEGYKILIEKGAIFFSGTITDKEVDGRQCKEVHYTRDYSILTGIEKKELGIQAGPQNFEEYWCISGNEALEKNVTATVGSRSSTSYFKLVEADYNYTGTIEFPQAKEKKAEPLLLELVDKERKVDQCLSSTTPGRCVFELSIREFDSSYCQVAQDRKSSCYINWALQDNDTKYCENLKEDNEGYGDCYLELAVLNKDQSFCNSIPAEDKKETCMNASSPSSG